MSAAFQLAHTHPAEVCFRGAFESVLLLGIWIGIGFLLRGVAVTVAAASGPDLPGRAWSVFMGVLVAVAGIIMITWPIASVATLTIFAGWWPLVIGVVEIVHCFQLRKAVLSHSTSRPQLDHQALRQPVREVVHQVAERALPGERQDDGDLQVLGPDEVEQVAHDVRVAVLVLAAQLLGHDAGRRTQRARPSRRRCSAGRSRPGPGRR